MGVEFGTELLRTQSRGKVFVLRKQKFSGFRKISLVVGVDGQSADYENCCDAAAMEA